MGGFPPPSLLQAARARARRAVGRREFLIRWNYRLEAVFFPSRADRATLPARHLEGVYPTNTAILSRVVAAEDQGTKLRLADGTSLLVPGYSKYISNGWRLPYKVLLTDNKLTLYHLLDGRRISVQPAK